MIISNGYLELEYETSKIREILRPVHDWSILNQRSDIQELLGKSIYGNLLDAGAELINLGQKEFQLLN